MQHVLASSRPETSTLSYMLQIISVSRYAIVAYGIVMGVLAIILQLIGLNLGWVYLFMVRVLLIHDMFQEAKQYLVANVVVLVTRAHQESTSCPSINLTRN